MSPAALARAAKRGGIPGGRHHKNGERKRATFTHSVLVSYHKENKVAFAEKRIQLEDSMLREGSGPRKTNATCSPFHVTAKCQGVPALLQMQIQLCEIFIPSSIQ